MCTGTQFFFPSVFVSLWVWYPSIAVSFVPCLYAHSSADARTMNVQSFVLYWSTFHKYFIVHSNKF